MKHKKGLVALCMVMTLIVGTGIGGTVAFLLTKTTDVTNTFTYGDINLKLEEHDENNDIVTERTDIKIIPGKEIKKDPFITVKNGSEDCWLYVKVKKENWPNEGGTDLLTYTLADGWTKVESNQALGEDEALFYKEISDVSSDLSIQVLKDDKVNVSENLTKVSTDNEAPKLTFTAYAIQKECGATAQEAWEAIEISDFVESTSWTTTASN